MIGNGITNCRCPFHVNHSARGNPEHECRPLTHRNQLITLIVSTVFKYDDPIVRPRTTLSERNHFRFNVNGIAVKYGSRKTHLVPAKIAHCCAQRGFAN